MRRSSGLLPAELLCASRVLPRADLLLPGRADVLRACGLLPSRLLPGRPELLCAGRMLPDVLRAY